ncbi:ABC transporter permease [Falsiroseomonas sp. E2-1-a4]|uniref:ABC transporter permease n=1 Tax=Falsiroseomonas sp. E2-1-a4 TaxID=3239299 RepID=UPI003F3C05EB
MRRDPAVLLALLVVVVLATAALGADWIAPANPLAIGLRTRLHPPFWMEGGDPRFLLGTDHLGRDLLSRMLYGLRVSLLVGVAAATLSAVLGGALGLLAGYLGRGVDVVAMRVADVQLAFPLLVLAIAVIGIVGASLPAIILVLGLWGWAGFARVMRAEVMVQRELDYVQAATVAGATPLRVMWRHILPNVASSAIVLWTFAVAQAVVVEGALGFVGLGVRPPAPSLGSIMNDGRQVLGNAWWVMVMPGCLLVALVVALNVLGDALRDWLDPRRVRH